jgi:hypothetical protein
MLLFTYTMEPHYRGVNMNLDNSFTQSKLWTV